MDKIFEYLKERCENCGRHPFCEYYYRCIYGKGNEKLWVKRDRQLKLEKKKNLNFEFKEIK